MLGVDNNNNADTLAKRSVSHGMLKSLPRWQTPTFRPLHRQLAPQLRWQRPENKPSIRRIVRVLRVPADCLETLGPINESAVQFLNDLGHRITSVSADDKEAQFLVQRLSIALQRSNAILLHESFWK